MIVLPIDAQMKSQSEVELDNFARDKIIRIISMFISHNDLGDNYVKP